VIFGAVQNAHGQYDSYPIDGYTELNIKNATTLHSLCDLNKNNEVGTNSKIVFKE